MWINPSLAVVAAVASAGVAPAALIGAFPILLLWLIAPVLAWWLSQPRQARAAQLRPDQRQFLRRVQRLTWRYFETFISAETHYLPPDNYQETGAYGLDARTSPTNIGMGLLAYFVPVAALGFLERVEPPARTLQR